MALNYAPVVPAANTSAVMWPNVMGAGQALELWGSAKLPKKLVTGTRVINLLRGIISPRLFHLVPINSPYPPSKPLNA